MAASKRILLIEDDAETAGLIAEDLQERDYVVSIELDGHAGLSAILKTEPDLVLCDINMPGMTGFEVVERLIALAPQLDWVPFIFLTARTDRDSELKGRRLGADDYVTKPIDFEILASIIDARLGKSAQRGLVAPCGAQRARAGVPHLVGARQDFTRDREDREHQQAHGQFPHRERLPEIERVHADRGRGEGDLGPDH
jgi:DNA-binding response OmpR family regulator